jgi:putative ABC transport system permease protein
MSLFSIALRSIVQRAVASGLTATQMALGVMLVVAVLTIHGVLTTSFTSAKLGYNMIVGAKGGKEQLVLNTVYYLSSPVENISYDYYMEFLRKEQRAILLKDSLRLRGHEQLWQTAEVAAVASPTGVENLAIQAALAGEKQVDTRWQDLDRNGMWSNGVQLAIPVCLGDYFGRFRVVGTTPAMFNDLVFDIENQKKYEFAQGRNFQHRSKEHGYFEAVVGSAVAEEMEVKLGDSVQLAHGGSTDTNPDVHVHERKFIVVGILKHSGTPNDKAVFVNMEGFFLMEDHAKSVDDKTKKPTDEPEEKLSEEEMKRRWEEKRRLQGKIEREPDPDPLPNEQREITSLLLVMDQRQAYQLAPAVNKGKEAQAVGPIAVIVGMFESIVAPVQSAMLFLACVVCVVSGISILVSIYNSMNERRQEIAVMRALGADRFTVSQIILYEAMLLSLGGCILGWLLGHVGCYIASPYINRQTNVEIGFHWFGEPYFHPLDLIPQLANTTTSEAIYFPAEWLIVPSLLVLSILVGLVPARTAYRTDVARSLGK